MYNKFNRQAQAQAQQISATVKSNAARLNAQNAPTPIRVECPIPQGMNVNDNSFSWTNIYPDNYFNLDGVASRARTIGGWPVFTISAVVIDRVVDPEAKEALQDKTPKIIVEFQETSTRLVMNKTRCRMMEALTGSPHPAQWGAVMPKIVLYVGVEKGKEQVLIGHPTTTKLPTAPTSVVETTDSELDDLFA
jgi:hypothetical protein